MTTLESEVLKLIKSPQRLKKLAQFARESGIATLTLGPLSLSFINPPSAIASQAPPLPEPPILQKTREQQEKELEELLFYSAT